MNCLVSAFEWIENKLEGAFVCQLNLISGISCIVLFSLNIHNHPALLLVHVITHITVLFSNKIDETISLDNLQKLKLAFEVLYELHLFKTHWQSRYAFLQYVTSFFLAKEFERGGSRSIDAKCFGLIVKKCLGLPKTVRTVAHSS